MNFFCKLSVVFFLLSASPFLVFAIGGEGATCNPSTPNWGSCELEPVPFQEFVTNTVNVPGGHYATPYIANQANTQYILQGDINAEGSAIAISANYVIIDLNGYTITYNISLKGEGVAATGGYNHIAIRNGSIIQSLINAGKIVSVAIGNGGSGYATGDVLTLDGPKIDAQVTVNSVDEVGMITGIELTTPGSGFEVTANYRDPNGFQGPVTGGSGSGAVINVTETISEGLLYGNGRNPISTCTATYPNCRNSDYVHIANLYLKYGGRDVGGIRWPGVNGIIEQVTTEDLYEFGTLKHRDYGVAGIFSGTYSIIRNNTIINTRHKGIHTESGANIYGNNISLRSIATNSFGILGYNTQDVVTYSNTIIGRGEMPIGIGYVSEGTNNIEVYNNYVDVKTTALGEEYASAYYQNPEATYTSNNAAGFRTTWGGNNLSVHDNEFHVTSETNFIGTFSPTGAVARINGQGHGIWAGILESETAVFYNNKITAMTDSSDGAINGIACLHNFSDGLFFIGNTVTSNLTNIAFDQYGTGCQGFPLFKGNTLIREGSFARYDTIADRFTGYWNNTGRFVDNIYQNGATEDNIDLNPEGSKSLSVYFGSVIDGEYKYSYRLHDNNNTSNVLLREDFDPAITLPYANPGEGDIIAPDLPTGLVVL